MALITLQDPQICGQSIAEQMNANGVSIGCAHVKKGKHNIYQLFRNQLAGVYESVGQGKYSKPCSGTCELCGHPGLSEYYIVKNNSNRPAITRHPQYGIEFEWPNMFSMGSSCINLLEISHDKNKMFDSMFQPGTHLPYTLTQNGMIHTGNFLLRHYDKWMNDLIIIPHSLFTVLPANVIQAIGAEIYVLRNPALPGECTETALLRSFYAESRKAKYKLQCRVTDVMVNNGKCGVDAPYDYYVTVVHKSQAKQMMTLYKQHKI